MRKIVYTVFALISLYFYMDSKQTDQSALIVSIWLLISADMADIKDQIEKLKKP